MSDKDAILSAGAVALSTAATLAALIAHLRQIGAISEEAEQTMYRHAAAMLEESQVADESGVFTAARELIEEHLRPTKIPKG